MPPWIAADYLLGFCLGIALGLMAIDTGMREARTPQPPPPIPTQFPGP